MTLEEAKKAIDGFKADGLTNEEVAIVLHDMFANDKLTIDELDELVGLVGYHLTEEFRNLPVEQQKERLYDEVDEEEFVNGDEDGAEDGEKDEHPGEGEEPKKPEPDAEPESEEEEKARKLFGLNK
jgi:hypothetical protein